MLVKCKPVYNFQSVEFEFEIPDGVNDIKLIEKFYDGMFKMYEECLHRLKNIAVEQPPLAKPVPVKQEIKASPKQVNLLIKLGVDEQEAKNMSATLANKKINELING